PLAVAVGVEDERGPTLRLLFIVGLIEQFCVQPPYGSSASTAARPQGVVGILGKHQVMRAKTGVNECYLLCFRIVHGELPATGFEREQHRRRVARSFSAERR